MSVAILYDALFCDALVEWFSTASDKDINSFYLNLAPFCLGSYIGKDPSRDAGREYGEDEETGEERRLGVG